MPGNVTPPPDWLAAARGVGRVDAGTALNPPFAFDAIGGYAASSDATIQRLRFIHAHPELLAAPRPDLGPRCYECHLGNYASLHDLETAVRRVPHYPQKPHAEFLKDYQTDLRFLETHLKIRAKFIGEDIFSARQKIIEQLDVTYRSTDSSWPLADLAWSIAQMLVVAQGLPLPMTVEMKDLLATDLATLAPAEAGAPPAFLDVAAAPDTAAELAGNRLPYTYAVPDYAGGDIIAGRMVGPQRERKPRWEADGAWESEWTFGGLSPFHHREEVFRTLTHFRGTIPQLRETLFARHPILPLLRHYMRDEEYGYYLANTVRMTNRFVRNLRLLGIILALRQDLGSANASFAEAFVNAPVAAINWLKYKPLFLSAALGYYTGPDDPLRQAVEGIAAGFTGPWTLIDVLDIGVMMVGLAPLLLSPVGIALSPVLLATVTAAGVGIAFYRAAEAQVEYASTGNQKKFEAIDPALMVVEQADDRNAALFFLALELVSVVPLGKAARILSDGATARAAVRTRSVVPAPLAHASGIDTAARGVEGQAMAGARGLVDAPAPPLRAEIPDAPAARPDAPATDVARSAAADAPVAALPPPTEAARGLDAAASGTAGNAAMREADDISARVARSEPTGPEPLHRALEPRLPPRNQPLRDQLRTLAPGQWAELAEWQARLLTRMFEDYDLLARDAGTVEEMIKIAKSWSGGRAQLGAIAATGELTILRRLHLAPEAFPTSIESPVGITVWQPALPGARDVNNPKIAQIAMVASRSGQRTPDFDCLLTDGRTIAVEVRTVTGTPGVRRGSTRPRNVEETMSLAKYRGLFPQTSPTGDKIVDAVAEKIERDQIGHYKSQGYIAVVVEAAADPAIVTPSVRTAIEERMRNAPHVLGVRVLIGDRADAFIAIDNPARAGIDHIF
jgi:hypothetical protein